MSKFQQQQFFEPVASSTRVEAQWWPDAFEEEYNHQDLFHQAMEYRKSLIPDAQNLFSGEVCGAKIVVRENYRLCVRSVFCIGKFNNSQVHPAL